METLMSEMCVAYLLFYRPRSHGVPQRDTCVSGLTEIPCKENHTVHALTSESELSRVFGTPPRTCKAIHSTTTVTRLDDNPYADKALITGGTASTVSFRLFTNVSRTIGLIAAACLLLCQMSLLRSCRTCQVLVQ